MDSPFEKQLHLKMTLLRYFRIKYIQISDDKISNQHAPFVRMPKHQRSKK